MPPKAPPITTPRTPSPISADNAKTYVVGVRAGNDSGWSAWTNSAPIAPQLPAAPASVTLTRSAGQLTVAWTAVSEATSYNINLSGDGTNSWTRAESGVTGTGNTITKTIDSGIENWRWYIAAVQSVNTKGAGGWANSEFVGPIYPPGQVRNLNAERVGTGISVTWTAPANNGGSAVTGYDVNYTVDGVHSWTRVSSNQSATSATIPNVSNAVDYVVAVRANNGVGDGGPWTNSAPVAGLAGPASVTALKGGDYVEGEWSTVAGATGYDVNLLYFQNEYHYRIETNMSGTSRRIYISDGSSFSPEQFVIAVRARNDHGPGAWVNSPPATAAPELDASSVTTTTATLTISNYSGNWHYQANTGPDSSCKGPVNASTKDLTGLTAGTEYTYTAYDKSGCASADAIASETFTTPELSSSSISATGATLTLSNHSGNWHYQANKAPDNTCQGPVSGSTKDLTGLTAGTSYTYTAYSDSGCASAMATTTFTTPAGLTASSVAETTATLNIAGHTGQWWYKADIAPDNTCKGPVSGASQNLTGLTEHGTYTYTAYSDSCSTEIARATFTTTGDTLTATNVTASSVTLTIYDHTGNWYYKANFWPHTSCSSAQTGTTVNLSGLAPGTAYTYKAYNDGSCANLIATADAFTTGGVSVSNLGKTLSSHVMGVNTTSRAANFTTGNNSSGYTLHSVTAKFNAKVGAPAALMVEVYSKHDSKSEPGSSQVTLTGSNPNTAGDYTYTCPVNNNGCNLPAGTTYYLVLSAPGSPTTNAEYRWQTTQSTDQTNTPGSADWEIGNRMLTKIEGGTWGDSSGIDISGLFKVAATVNPAPLTASDISGTGATLTVANHSGAWSYKGISGTSASTSCVDVSSGTTATLSSLTANNLYGYTAYSGANCTGTELAREYFSTNDFDVGNLGEGAASGSCLVGYSAGSRKCAMPFTTGDRSGGYTLKSITAEFNAKQEITGTLGNIIVAIHAEDTVNSANPAATAKVTLDGNNPNTAGLYSYTCSGSDCSLSKETKYFIVMSTADTDGVKFYQMKLTTSDAEAVHPSGNEWSIENVGREKNGSAAWVDLASSQTGLLHIAADD